MIAPVLSKSLIRVFPHSSMVLQRSHTRCFVVNLNICTFLRVPLFLLHLFIEDGMKCSPTMRRRPLSQRKESNENHDLLSTAKGSVTFNQDHESFELLFLDYTMSFLLWKRVLDVELYWATERFDPVCCFKRELAANYAAFVVFNHHFHAQPTSRTGPIDVWKRFGYFTFISPKSFQMITILRPRREAWGTGINILDSIAQRG